MPLHNNKIFVVSILCVAVVISVWLFQRKPEENSAILEKPANVIAVGSLIDLPENTNDEWKKILTNIKPEKTLNLTSSNEEKFDEMSMTDQMARDLFSRYLLVANQEGGISTNDANKIADDVLSSPIYVKPGVNYIPSNLHTKTDTSRASIQKYADTLNQFFQNRFGKIRAKDDPASIYIAALNKEDENKIKEIDPVIVAGKGFVNDILKMDVPSELVSLHLILLNTSNNLLTTIEGLRKAFTDPIISLVAIKEYAQNLQNFEKAIANIDAYLTQRLDN